MKPLIYLDNNATTPMLPAVWEAMTPYLWDCPGNPSSSHQAGRQARRALEDARERLASLLDAHPDEIIFTSGATEANNLAIFGLAGGLSGSLVSSPIEHPSVIEPIRQLAGAAASKNSTDGSGILSHVTLPVTAEGIVDVQASTFPGDARLVAVMLANHETGAMQPVEALTAKLQGKALFHCDAAAAAGKMPISFRNLGVTSLTISGHKFHGPKGIGALVLKRGVKLRPQTWGGHQQQGRRPGTEPVPLVIGMTEALALSLHAIETNHAQMLKLRQRFLDLLRELAGPVVLNGPQDGNGLPHAMNLSFPGCTADALLISLDLEGVACSTGSACSSGSLLPSPVLQAMGKTGAVLNSAMRFSLSLLQSEADVEEAARRIAQCVNKLRRANAGDDLQAARPE